jgi:hypothetical protein
LKPLARADRLLAAYLGVTLGERVVSPFVYTAASKSKLAYDFLAAVKQRSAEVLQADGGDGEFVRVLRAGWSGDLRGAGEPGAALEGAGGGGTMTC